MHPGAWIAWVMLVMVLALATTNPLYLAILLLCIVLVAVLAPRTGNGVASFRALVIFGAVMLAVSIAVATINGNYGDHILFTVPGPNVPGWLGGLRLGGPVSAEGLVAAAIRGIAIICIFLAFGVFNGAVSPHRVLRTTPGALFHASLVLTVGLTLLPSSVEDLRRIREMRALRGAPSGLRDLPALVVPAVINGLERSMQLAEAMEARGYGAGRPVPTLARVAAAASAPCLIFAAWFWFYSERWQWAGGLLVLTGVASLGAWLWIAGHTHTTTSYADEPVPRVQRAGILASGGLFMAVLVARSMDMGGFQYNPFAGLPAPAFSVLGALAMISAAWPAALLLAPSRRARTAASVGTEAISP